MAYNQNIPQPTDQLSQSQADILNNFQAINTLVGVNHANFGTANQGMHNEVQMPVNAAPPAGVAGIGQLFTQTVSGASQLFWQGDVATKQQLTGAISATANGYTTLPGGIIIQWGSVTIASGPYGIVTFPIAFPNAVFSINCTPAQNPLVPTAGGIALNIYEASTTVAGFTAYGYLGSGYVVWGASHPAFNWIAIGN